MKKDENTFMVKPVDKEKILKKISTIPKQENEEFVIDVGALVGCIVIVDENCIYSFLEPRFINGNPQMVYDVPVRIKTRIEDGWSFPVAISFYYPITLEELCEYLKPDISLKEYMGSRYDYNPRIKINMRDFLDDMNETLNINV